MMSLQSDKNEAHELAALQQRDNKEENLVCRNLLKLIRNFGINLRLVFGNFDMLQVFD